ncbi:MAG: hypothetical protein KTR32_22095, partial [Granulosicoccus sp.]|nr:hypothetical protein [Granulosicoccus sp.]
MNANRLRQFAGVILIFLTMMAGALALTDDGIVIDNQARLTYVDNDTGLLVNVISNVSSVSVAALYRFNLLDDQSTQSYGGRQVQFSHQLVNTGNVDDQYSLIFQNRNGDASDLELLTLYHDVNGNGLVDSSEPLLAQPPDQLPQNDESPAADVHTSFVAITPELAPGDVLELVAFGTVPVDALDGTVVDVELVASSQNGSLPAQSNIDRVNITGHARIELSKVLSPSCDVGIYPGDTVTYTIEFTNSGDRPPALSTQFIDDSAQQGLVIVNELPGNALPTDSEPAVSSHASATVVVQQMTDGNRWTSLSSWDGVTQINRIGLFLPDGLLQPGMSGSWDYELQAIDASAGDSISTQAYIDINADGRAEYQSNPVCNTFVILGAAKTPALSFVEPALSLQQQATTPEFSAAEDFVDAGLYRLDSGNQAYDPAVQGVFLQLELSALDPTRLLTDDNGQRFVTVELSSENTGDRLWVVMMETVPDSGIFRNIVPITLSTDRPAADRFCPGGADIPPTLQPDYSAGNENCTLLSAINDRLLASFNDTQGSIALADVAVVDPVSTVFDAVTLEPVAGALVEFINATTGQVAQDLFSGESLSRMTDELGHYHMPRLPDGAGYYINVQPPAEYQFPSTAIAREYAGFQVDQYSFGREGSPSAQAGSGVFAVVAGELPPTIDIPLDRIDINSQLGIQKRALQAEVAPGEVVAFEVVVVNSGDSDLQRVRVR